MMARIDHDRNIPNTKFSSSSNGKLDGPEEHDEIVSRSRRSTDVRGIIAPSRRDEQLMRQVSGLDFDDIDKNNLPDDEGIILTGPASEIGGIIAPTKFQRQLMRQVSALGLEDPIFGKNLYADDEDEEPNFVFDDMDINDVPEDMRDMFSLASDRTDQVDTDYEVQSVDSKSNGSMPPLGLEEAANSDAKKKLRKGKKPRRTSFQSVSSEDMYVPPAPVFAAKPKTSKGERQASGGDVTEHSRSVDHALAARVDAMLSMNESRKSGEFSGHSRGSHTGHSRGSYTGHSRALKKGTRPKPRRQDSRFSVASGIYAPPSMPSEGASQRGERHMPDSMDEIFSPKAPSRKVRKKKSTRSTEEKKKKKKAKAKSFKVPKDADFEVS